MDSTGKFMKARIWCCNASREAAMCYNVEVNGSGFLLTDAVFFITLLSLISPPASLLLQKLVSSVLSLFSPPTNTLCTSASGPFRHSSRAAGPCVDVDSETERKSPLINLTRVSETLNEGRSYPMTRFMKHVTQNLSSRAVGFSRSSTFTQPAWNTRELLRWHTLDGLLSIVRIERFLHSRSTSGTSTITLWSNKTLWVPNICIPESLQSSIKHSNWKSST